MRRGKQRAAPPGISISGYVGGYVDRIIMGLVDVVWRLIVTWKIKIFLILLFMI